MRDEVIQNSGCSDLVQSPWLEAVDFLSQKIFNESKNTIAIYVVGSIARGKAITKESDLDLVVILEKPEDLTTFIADLIKTATQKYNFIHHFDIDLIVLQELLSEKKFFVKNFVLKTQSAFITGKDIREQLPEYRINIDLAKQLLENLDVVVEKRLRRIAKANSYNLKKEQCKFAMKELIRALYFLTIPILFEFTNDKAEMLNMIPVTFPELSVECKRILELFTHPIEDASVFQSFYLEVVEKIKIRINNL